MTQSNLEATLEAMIDSEGITAVLTAIEAVCFEKGDHLRSNWQDEKAAKHWDKVGTRIGIAIVASRNIP